MTKKGILTKWNDDKGYGFITPVDSKKEIFVHANEFKDRNRRPSLNQNLTFSLSRSQGKVCAINVEIDDMSTIIRKKGILTKWNDDKGYGFITPVGEKKEIFIHISDFQGRPIINDKVSFTLSKDKNDRDCAINAIKFNKAKLTYETKKSNNIKFFSILSLATFYFTLFYFIKNGTIEMYVFPYYIFIGIFTFFIYSKDKDNAQDDNWRISENTLHILSIIGGWTGAIVAQDILQHKSSKTSFRIIFFITIIFNLFLLFKFGTFKYV